MEFYGLTEQQVYRQSARALQQGPEARPATISRSPPMSPRPTTASSRCALEDALKAWTNTLPSPMTKSSARAFISTSPGSSSSRPLRRSPRASQRRHQRHVRRAEETPDPQPRRARTQGQGHQRAAASPGRRLTQPPDTPKPPRNRLRPSSDLGFRISPPAARYTRNWRLVWSALCSASLTASSRAGNSIGWLACRLGNSSSRW